MSQDEVKNKKFEFCYSSTNSRQWVKTYAALRIAAIDIPGIDISFESFPDDFCTICIKSEHSTQALSFLLQALNYKSNE